MSFFLRIFLIIFLPAATYFTKLATLRLALPFFCHSKCYTNIKYLQDTSFCNLKEYTYTQTSICNDTSATRTKLHSTVLCTALYCWIIHCTVYKEVHWKCIGRPQEKGEIGCVTCHCSLSIFSMNYSFLGETICSDVTGIHITRVSLAAQY